LISFEKKLSKDNPKILLIHPSFRYTGTDRFPLGLGYIASHLKNYSKNVIIYDEQHHQLGKTYLEQLKPDIVGISTDSPAFARTQNLLKSIRRLPDSIRPLVIMGGTHPTFCPEEVLSAGADVVFHGESDTTIHQFMKNGMNRLNDINGISYKIQDEVIRNKESPLIQDLDSIPFPARELFDPNLYPVMSLTTSRGCPYNCYYCSATKFWKNHLRYHSVEYVESELEQIASLGYKFICFEDATFSTKVKRTRKICQSLMDNSKLKNLVWSCETRPDHITPDLLQIFHDSRCALINLGIESASETVLKLNNRNVSLDLLYKGMNYIQESKIPFQALIIFGLPGETKETIEETIKFLEEVKPDRILLSLATAYPGTELWKSTQRIKMPLKWVRKFTGHGEFSPLYLPENMTSTSYKFLAEKLLTVVNQINAANLKEYKKKQNQIINK
jgi:anaerobic magnesium-protoporphyrin IX monomethyl ester cyclase